VTETTKTFSIHYIIYRRRHRISFKYIEFGRKTGRAKYIFFYLIRDFYVERFFYFFFFTRNVHRGRVRKTANLEMKRWRLIVSKSKTLGGCAVKGPKTKVSINRRPYGTLAWDRTLRIIHGTLQRFRGNRTGFLFDVGRGKKTTQIGRSSRVYCRTEEPSTTLLRTRTSWKRFQTPECSFDLKLGPPVINNS